MIEVRGLISPRVHLVPGGKDRMGMPDIYQTTLCGRLAPELGWHYPSDRIFTNPHFATPYPCAACEKKRARKKVMP